MGDLLNEYSGGLSFSQTDVSLPGNHALPVAVGRRLATGTRQNAGGTGLFGDWDLEIPHLRTVALQTRPDWYGGNTYSGLNQYRCSQFEIPPSGISSTPAGIRPESYWDGHHLFVPGAGGDQTLLRRSTSPANPIQPSDGASYPVVTKELWQLSCLPTMERGSGEGFLARAPDGSRYRFDHMVQRNYPSYNTSGNSGTVGRIEILILPTLITDRFGNWVRYTYGGSDGWRVSAITSSDGRSITFSYNGSGNRIGSVSDGTRTWSYGYDGNGALQTVTLPDNSQWRFAVTDLEKDPTFFTDLGCGQSNVLDTATHIGTITHPSGAVGTFGLKMTQHGRSNVPGSDEGCEGTSYQANLVSRYFNNYALVNKTLSGPGMPAMSWNYTYGPAMGGFACAGCSMGSKTVTITDPHNAVILKTFGTGFGVNDGLLMSSSVGPAGGSSLQTTTFRYRASNAGPYPSVVGYNAGFSDSMSAIYTPQDLRVITQQGVTMTQAATGFNVYAQPTGATKYNDLGYQRDESTAYDNNAQLWVLGQTAAHDVAGLTALSVGYDPGTALPTASYRFGKLQATYGFNTDGTLASIADGLSQTTTFGDYKRGLPQTIVYADNTRMSAVVDNIGGLSSVTNEAGTTWNYGYDAMGRLESKAPPGGDPVAYNATTLAFVQVPYDEYGLGANHWRQTIATGNAVTVNYFDARWRKLLTHTYDAANPGATQRMQRFEYDAYNRTTYASYPARAINSITQSAPGTTSQYDPLGRVVLNSADSELGTLNTSTQYLSGLQKQVTNPRGFVTTTAYQVFDTPSEDDITAITAPEGVSVSINRDIFGKPLAITRGGAYAGSGPASVSRSYVYDGFQRLCKTVESEIGATIEASWVRRRSSLAASL